MSHSILTNEQLIATLKTAGSLNDLRHETAFRCVDRQAFLPEMSIDRAYHDCFIPLLTDERGEVRSTASRPSTLVGLLDLLQLEPGMNVLEIGTGTGYFSALLHQMLSEPGMPYAAPLTTLEIEPRLAQAAHENLSFIPHGQIEVITADGADGYAANAPYDRIVATTGLWDMPTAWIEQLKPGGWIVAPVFLDGVQVCAAFQPQDDGSLEASGLIPSSFVYIQGKAAGPRVRKRIGSTAMSIIADEVDRFDAVALATLLIEDYERVQLSRALPAESYWHGFVPYLMLSEVPNQVFALYHVEERLAAFGVEGEGFVLLTAASACFVPYHGNGLAHSFAGADAFLQLEQHLRGWKSAGEPGLEQLKLRFVPRNRSASSVPASTIAKTYIRDQYRLHVWMESRA